MPRCLGRRRVRTTRPRALPDLLQVRGAGHHAKTLLLGLVGGGGVGWAWARSGLSYSRPWELKLGEDPVRPASPAGRDGGVFLFVFLASVRMQDISGLAEIFALGHLPSFPSDPPAPGPRRKKCK